MKIIYKIHFLTILLLLPVTLLATSPIPPPLGPIVPCVGCEDLTATPYPETGVWSNPEQSPGTGLSFEIQNGVLAGYLYTFSDSGQPEWYIISGPLVRSERPGVIWELNTSFTRVEGGSCIDCSYTPPDQITSGNRVSLYFKQRNYMMISIQPPEGQGPIPVAYSGYYVPFTYGSEAKAYFSEQTPYLLPVFSAAFNGVHFLLSGRDGSTQWVGEHVQISGPSVSGSPESRILSYAINMSSGNAPGPTIRPPPILLGQIICEIDENAGQPACIVEMWERTYRMPISNFGDSRFFAEAEGGSIIEAFRIDYN